MMPDNWTKTVKTADFEAFADAQEGWDARYRPLQVEAFTARMDVCRVGGIQIDIDTYNIGLEITATSPKDALNIALPLDARSAFISKGSEVTMDRIDVYGSGKDLHGVTKPASSLLTCSIYKEAIDTLADSPVLGTLTDFQHRGGVMCSDRRAIDDLRLWCARFLKLCQSNEIPARAQARMIDESLVVIYNVFGAARENRSVRHGKRYQIAQRARDYMIDRQSDPPTITEICNYLAISPRTLNYAFQDTYRVSPKRFLKARRLSAAHEALKHAVPGARVTDIALALGFWDFGHFAKDYRTMFGEIPSATLRA